MGNAFELRGSSGIPTLTLGGYLILIQKQNNIGIFPHCWVALAILRDRNKATSPEDYFLFQLTLQDFFARTNLRCSVY
jgi:hypothetical protein